MRRTDAWSAPSWSALGRRLELRTWRSTHRAGPGHGRALFSFAEDQAAHSGSTAVELYTNEAMVENIQLYPGSDTSRPDDVSSDGYGACTSERAWTLGNFGVSLDWRDATPDGLTGFIIRRSSSAC